MKEMKKRTDRCTFNRKLKLNAVAERVEKRTITYKIVCNDGLLMMTDYQQIQHIIRLIVIVITST